MKINFITESKPGWVLRWMCESLIPHIPNSYITDFKPDGKSDVNIYCNYYLFTKKTKQIDIPIFTHFEEVNRQRWEFAVQNADHIFAQSSESCKFLPDENITVLHPWADKQFRIVRPVRFGIVGTEKRSKRKNFHWVKDHLSNIPNTEFVFTNGHFDFKDLTDFYEDIDYLLILSKTEGGPIPFIESLYMRKPIICPNIGYGIDYPCYKYDGLEELKDMIIKLTCMKETEENVSEQIMGVSKCLIEKIRG